MIILFWPMLWENPIQNMIKVILNLANHPLNLNVFFLGKTISVTDVPWYYLFTWIFISTPILNISLFFLGILTFLTILFGINKKMKLKDLDINFILLIFVPILVPIILGSTLYNGWRHVYFIYPYMVYFMVFFVFFIIEKN